MQKKEAAGIVSLPNKVLSFFHFAETELVQQHFTDAFLEIGESEVTNQTVRDDFAVVGLLLAIDFDEGLINDLLIIVFDCSELP